MNHEVIEKKLKELEVRALKIGKTKTQLEKIQAVKESQYEQALEKLNSLGIDAADMDQDELQALLDKTEKDLEQATEELENTVETCEALIEKFQKLLG
jgi:hypothetical protein